MENYSVLMSVYKNERPDYLNSSLDSMLCQSVSPNEILLVQDGPLEEDLIRIITSYKNRFPDIFTIIISQKNIGLGRALTLGLQHCKYELVARMDADDISLPERCKLQLETFERHPELDILGTFSSDFEDNPSNIVSTRVVPLHPNEIYKRGKTRSPFNHPTVMFRKSSVLRLGGYADLRRGQDADLFGRMLFAGCKTSNLDQVLLLMRVSDDSRRRRRRWSHVRDVMKVRMGLYRIGYSSLLDFLSTACFHVIIFLMPLFIQKLLYTYFLRERVKLG